MTQILVTKPDTLNQRDKAALRRAGVVVIEADNPSDVKLIQANGAELSGGDMLYAAISAIAKDQYTGNVAQTFPKIMAQMMKDAREKAQSS